MRPPPRRQLRRRRPAAHISGKLLIAVLQLQPAEYSVDRILRRKPNKASNWRRSPGDPHVEKARWAGKPLPDHEPARYCLYGRQSGRACATGKDAVAATKAIAAASFAARAAHD